MDAIGFILATSFLGAVFAVFYLAVRLLGDAAADIRYSVVPAMLGGFREWGGGRGTGPDRSPGASIADGTGPPPAADAGQQGSGREDSLPVTLEPLRRRVRILAVG